MHGGDVVFAYQGGVDPESLDHEPGRLATMATVKLAIENGFHVLRISAVATSLTKRTGGRPHAKAWNGESSPIMLPPKSEIACGWPAKEHAASSKAV